MKCKSQIGKFSLDGEKGVDDALVAGMTVETLNPDASELVISELAKTHGLSGNADENQDWPPNPEDLPDSPALPDIRLDDLPRVLRSFVASVSENLQVPLLFPGSALITSFGAVIGSGLRLRPKKNDKTWVECANLWCVLVGPPSVKKSPALEMGLRPLRVVDRFEDEQYKENLIKWRARESTLKAQKEGIEEAIKQKSKGGKSAAAIERSDEDLQEALEVIEKELAQRPRRLSIYSNDATQEATLMLQEITKTGVALVRDEFAGLICKLDGNKDNGDRQYLMEGYSGGKPYRSNRVTKEAPSTESNTITLLGTTQHGPLGHLVSQMKKNPLVEDGFLQRAQLVTIFDMPPAGELVDKRHDPIALMDIEEVSLKIHKAIREAASSEALHFKCLDFDEEAQQEFGKIYREIQEFANSHRDNKHYFSHVLKSPKTLCSLALIFEVVRQAAVSEDVVPLSIGYESLSMAWEWMKVLYIHAERMYQLDETVNNSSVQAIIDRIKSRDIVHGMSVREIKRKNWSFLKEYKDLTEALRIAQELGWCKVESQKKERGAPSTVVLLHPLLR